MNLEPAEHNIWKGAAAGLMGGLAASYVMNQFQTLWSHLTAEGGQNGQSESGQEEEPTTVKAAAALSEGVLDHPLSETEKQTAGPAVHYSFGTAVGGVYGALAEVAPQVTMGAGLPFGLLLWLLADEAAVPALGLSKPPTEYPASTHTYTLASHLVYGLTTEGVRRTVRQAF